MKLLGAFLLAALWWRYKIGSGGQSTYLTVGEGAGTSADPSVAPPAAVSPGTDTELIAAVERLLGTL